MSKKIALTVVAATAKAKKDFSNKNFTTSGGKNQLAVADLLAFGEENARTSRELCPALNVKGPDFRHEVAKERLNGAPIISGNAGYWLSGNKSELLSCARSLRRRASAILRVAAALEKTAGRYER